jgi:hypothetical protein
MNTDEEIKIVTKMLVENNRLGMSASKEPFHWNFHQAIDALARSVEILAEDNRKLSEKVSHLERQLGKGR